MTSYQHRKSHCGDKTISRPSYLHNGISYTGKMTSLYWIRALEGDLLTPLYHYGYFIWVSRHLQVTANSTIYSKVYSGWSSKAQVILKNSYLDLQSALYLLRAGHIYTPVASFTKEVNPRLAKRPLKTNGHLANRGLTSLVKEATGHLQVWWWPTSGFICIQTEPAHQGVKFWR